MHTGKFDLTDFEGYQKGNPFMEYNHIKIVSVSPQCSQVSVELVPEGRNLNGVVHGGLLYTLADCVAGITARADGRNYATLSAHINFLRNVSQGRLTATGETLKRGRRMTVIHVRVEDDKGTLLVDAAVDMCVIGEEPER